MCLSINNSGVAKSKHNYDAVVSFIKQTTCFGPCTGPSSGLNVRVRGDYTARIFLKSWFITGARKSRLFITFLYTMGMSQLKSVYLYIERKNVLYTVIPKCVNKCSM
jgi:hypothetical protein